MCVEEGVPPTAAYEDDADSDPEDADELGDDLEIGSAASEPDSHKSASLESFSQARSRHIPALRQA